MPELEVAEKIHTPTFTASSLANLTAKDPSTPKARDPYSMHTEPQCLQPSQLLVSSLVSTSQTAAKANGSSLGRRRWMANHHSKDGVEQRFQVMARD
ncbi:hypothetical protein YC2023_046339 [Brassica napus]